MLSSLMVQTNPDGITTSTNSFGTMSYVTPFKHANRVTVLSTVPFYVFR